MLYFVELFSGIGNQNLSIALYKAEDLILRHILIIGKAHKAHTTLGEGIVDDQHEGDHIEDKIPNHQRGDEAVAVADVLFSCR